MQRLGRVVTLTIAVVIASSGCAPLRPDPGPACGPADMQEHPQELLDRLDTYGLWSPTWDSPPTAENLTRPAPVPFGFDPDRKIWLTSILLAPGVSGRVSIVKPQSAQLFVSTWDRWGSLTAPELQFGATRRVDLLGCDGIASYPALTIVDGPECVVFAVQQEDDNRIAQIPVSFFGAEC